MSDNQESAFPSTFKSLGPEEAQVHRWGMTLRDYFLAQSIQTAMQMVRHDLKKDREDFFWNEIEREIVASRACQLADAILKARNA
jgi:hypothetical protein